MNDYTVSESKQAIASPLLISHDPGVVLADSPPPSTLSLEIQAVQSQQALSKHTCILFQSTYRATRFHLDQNSRFAIWLPGSWWAAGCSHALPVKLCRPRELCFYSVQTDPAGHAQLSHTV